MELTNCPQGPQNVAFDSVIGDIMNSAFQEREELIGLFEDVNFYNEGNEGGEKIGKKIALLNDKIKGYEEEAQRILEGITDKEGLIKDQEDKLAATGEDMLNAISTFETNSKKASRQAARDAIRSYKNGNGDQSFEKCFEEAFYKNIGGLNANQEAIQALYERFEAQRAKIGDISGDIEKAINDVNGLKGQLENVQGTIGMLERTKSNMENSTVENAYKNVDTDNRIPIYSGRKAEVANELLAKYNPQFDKGTAKTEYTKEQLDVMNNYKPGNDSEKYTKGDIYRADQNPELKHLNEAIGKGMLTDLENAGLGKEDIMKFITDNWNVGIKEKDGKWSIPYGHGVQGTSDRTKTKATYQAISDMLGGAATANDVNPHQLERLQKAVKDDDILKTMYKAGFTFKEAMYTLTQIFPDAGITYDINNQSPERNYGLVNDSEQSGKLYDNIAKQIKNLWNVDATKNGPKNDDDDKGKRHDPFTFQMGDKTVTLIIDKDGDNKFDYNNATDNELVGSEFGVEELLALDGILDPDGKGDGVLTAEELEAGGIMFMVNDQEESVADSNDVDKYKDGSNYKGKGAFTNSVDFNMSYATAEMLGINNIDISTLTEGTGAGEDVATSTKKYDGTQEHFEDINGSSVINTFGVNFTDGTKIEGKETLNTASNLETFYGQVAASADNSKSIAVGLGDGAEDAFEDGIKGSDVIDDVLDELDYLQRHQGDQPTIESALGVDLTAEDIQGLTGTGHISAIEDTARKAAQRNIRDDDKAASAASKAVDKYLDEEIYTAEEQRKLEEEKNK